MSRVKEGNDEEEGELVEEEKEEKQKEQGKTEDVVVELDLVPFTPPKN